jgi:ribosomal protein L4
MRTSFSPPATCRAVILIKAASVNTYQVLDAGKLLFTKDALDEFVKRLA